MTRHLIIVSRSAPPDAGGYQRQVRLLAPRLRSGLGSIAWVGAVRDVPDRGDPEIAGVDRFVRIPAYRVPRRFRGASDLVVVLVAVALMTAQRVRCRPCSLLLLSPVMIGSVMLVRSARLLRVPVLARFPSPADASRARGRVVGCSANVTSCAPSPAQVRGSDFTVELLPNAVELPSRFARPSRERGRSFLYVGRLIESKRVDLLVAAWREIHDRLPDWELVIVGDGGSERESVERRLRALGARVPRCRFVGRQPDPTPYFARADVFVFPSASEGLPNVMLEAMAYGVPVIAEADRVTEWFSIVPPLLPWPQAPQGLGEAMLRAAEDEAARQLVGLQSRAFVAEHHSAEGAARRMLSMV